MIGRAQKNGLKNSTPKFNTIVNATLTYWHHLKPSRKPCYEHEVYGITYVMNIKNKNYVKFK